VECYHVPWQMPWRCRTARSAGGWNRGRCIGNYRVCGWSNGSVGEKSRKKGPSLQVPSALACRGIFRQCIYDVARGPAAADCEPHPVAAAAEGQ
jgi:hypothetical protein